MAGLVDFFKGTAQNAKGALAEATSPKHIDPSTQAVMDRVTQFGEKADALADGAKAKMTELLKGFRLSAPADAASLENDAVSATEAAAAITRAKAADMQIERSQSMAAYTQGLGGPAAGKESTHWRDRFAKPGMEPVAGTPEGARGS